MGIDISLQDERGTIIEIIYDEKNLLNTLLPRENKSLLAGVDPYGDTVFNRLQLDQFLEEWMALEKKEMTAEQAQHLKKIERLAMRCKEDVHRYLKFIGD